MVGQLTFILYVAALSSAFGLAGYYGGRALDEVRRYLPSPLQEEHAARSALDYFILNGAVPATARRDYLRANIFGCIAALLLTLFVAGEADSLIAIFIFGAITTLFVVNTVRYWLNYRR
jgi:hypothetical protein